MAPTNKWDYQDSDLVAPCAPGIRTRVRERVWGQLAQPDRACGVTPLEVSTGVTLCEPPLAT